MGEFGCLIHSRLLFFEGLWTLAPGPDLAVRTAMEGPSPEVVPGAPEVGSSLEEVALGCSLFLASWQQVLH